MGDEGQERIGVLVVSVRHEPDNGLLVAQLTAIDRLDATQQGVTVSGDAESVLAQVSRWLSAVIHGESLDWVTQR